MGMHPAASIGELEQGRTRALHKPRERVDEPAARAGAVRVILVSPDSAVVQDSTGRRHPRVDGPARAPGVRGGAE